MYIHNLRVHRVFGGLGTFNSRHVLRGPSQDRVWRTQEQCFGISVQGFAPDFLINDLAVTLPQVMVYIEVIILKWLSFRF